jgi:site-specific DNA recombinase
MVGCSAKSGRYFYYGCSTALKRGKSACPAKQVGRAKLEEAVVDHLKKRVLTEVNLQELVKLTNEELKAMGDEQREQLAALDGQLDGLRERLRKLYLAVETGKFDQEDLAPRIRELKTQIQILEQSRASSTEPAQDALGLVSTDLIRIHLADLKLLLQEGNVTDRRGFLRSFVRNIEIDNDRVSIDYSPPLGMEGKPLERQVLSLERIGS